MPERYAELRCKTNFSFLEGASHPEELVAQAARLGQAALAITDRNSLAGIVRAHVAGQAAGLKLLVGAEITPQDAPAVLLYAADVKAYGRLSCLITRGRRAAEKGSCHLHLADVAEHAAGLLAAVVVSPSDATDDVLPHLAFYREVFGDRCHLAASLHCGPDDDAWLDRLVELSRQARLPLVAHNDVHYHVPGRRMLHDVVTAIRHGLTVHDLGNRRFANAERYLKSPDQMRELFHRHPQALAHGLELADRCRFSLAELRYEYPEELCLPGETPTQRLATLTEEGAKERYPNGVPEKVAALLRRELVLIEELRYEAFFLTVWDVVQFARGQGILCQGRGSAANSAVCYCLGITSVDPDRSDVLFERFVSRERDEPPDIDVDFEHERREEVFRYVYKKYGRDRAGIAAEVVTYRPRSAVRDVGKALGLSLDLVERLARSIDVHEGDVNVVPRTEKGSGTLRNSEASRERKRPEESAGKRGPAPVAHAPGSPDPERKRAEESPGNRGPAPVAHAPGSPDQERKRPEESPGNRGPAPVAHAPGSPDPRSLGVSHLFLLAREILGFPRHLSQHVGGFVITRGPLSELVPIENAAMPERTVIQWDKNDLDTLGILKVDCLALGMLTAIHKCFDLIARHHGVQWTLAGVPAEDPATYAMIREADTVGVFQIESRAQMAMLPRLLPRCFYDLVVEVAIVRPGPIKGGLVHPYLRRRSGDEPVTHPDPLIEQVLGKTLGVPIFQEQVLRLAMVVAGCSAGEAEQLRRAMSARGRLGVPEAFREKLYGGIVARGLPESFAAQVFEQIKGFGEYGFPEAHAASFALLAYVSAWLKCHYPAAFTTALLNSQPMGFYAPAQLVRDAHEHGVTILPVDVNFSQWDCTLEDGPASGHEPDVTERASRRASRREPDVTERASPDVVEGRASRREPDVTEGVSLRLGFRLVRSFSAGLAPRIVAARNEGRFRSVGDFARRTRLGRPLLARLAAADAFGSLGLSRRAALWHVLAVAEELPLFAGLETADDLLPGLPEMPLAQEVEADYHSIGLSLKAHPVGLIRPELDQLGVVSAAEVARKADQDQVRVAGLVLLRQRPETAKGTVFITLEDETGSLNLICWPRVWQRFRKDVHHAVAMLAEGRIERAQKVVHVCVSRMEDLSGALRRITVKARDFR